MFRIILSTWLYNYYYQYQFYQKGSHTQKAKPVQGVRLQKQTYIHIPTYTVYYKLNNIQQNPKQ